MNDNTLRMVGVFKHYQDTHGVSAKQFAAWLYVLTPFAIAPEQSFFDQVFNSSGAFDTPLVVDGRQFDYSVTMGKDAEYIQKICTPLGLENQVFLQLAPVVEKYYPFRGPGGSLLSSDLFVVSAFYRFASMARSLGMSVSDFLSLAQLLDGGSGAVFKQLAGSPVVSTPAQGASFASDFLTLLMAFSHTAQWLGKRELSAKLVLSMVTPAASSTNIQGTAHHVAFIAEACAQLNSAAIAFAQFKSSGAPLLNLNNDPIDWSALLSGNAGLIDGGGFITDVADATDSVQGATTPIIKLIETVVNAQQLANEAKVPAMQALNVAVIRARQMQAGVATSLLAKTLGVTQPQAESILRWTGLTPYQWLHATWLLQGSVHNAADIPLTYLNTFYELARRALVCQQFSLSAAAVGYLVDNPAQFGLPPTYGEVGFSTLYTLGRYDDLLHQVGAAAGGTEDDILTYLQRTNSKQLTDPSKAAGLVAALLGWKQEQVQAGWVVLGGIAKTISDFDVLMRLQQVQIDTGLNVGQQCEAFSLERASGYDAWQAVGQAMVTAANHVQAANK
jgi:hypothetical protein